MVKKTFKEFLIEKSLLEAPITDYQTFGNFEKSSSFRHETDRKMVTSPKAIQNVHKKFGKTPYDFNLYFVNSAKANRHTEVGKVSLEWVQSNLDPAVGEALIKNRNVVGDSINMIFTNNKGVARIPLTPFMMAHRAMHAFARENRIRKNYNFLQVEKYLISQIKIIMEYYGNRNFTVAAEFEKNNRRNQLAMIYLFNQIATFKSARDKNIRDWFEVLNELGAQYIITGNIKFNSPPRCFGGGSFGNKQNFCAKQEDMEELSEFVETLSRSMEMMIDDILSSAIGGIYIM